MKNFLYIIIILSLWANSAFTQVSGQVSGRISDVDTGENLPGANVQILDTFLGASSDVDGSFLIRRVPPGKFRLRASFMGYKSSTVDVEIKPGRIFNIDFELKSTPIKVDQVIVTGSRQPQDLASAAASISVLGKREIQRRNSLRMDEALLSVPGLTVVGENINIRGGSGYNRLGGSRTLVLLDEVPILTSDLGEANWSILPVSEIEHIEVLKGAASSLYGSGAISGVVNVITKSPTRNHSLSFRQTSGLFDGPSVPEWKWTDDIRYFNKTDISYSNSVGPVGYRLAVSRHQSTGDRQNGFLNRWYVTGKTKWQIDDLSTLTFFSTYSNEERDLFLQWIEQNEALKVPPTELDNRFKISGYVGYLVYHKLFSPTFSTKVRLSYNQQLVGVPFNITNAFTPALGFSGELQMNWKPHSDHSISFGFDYKYDNVESLYYGKQSANGVSPYIQEIWKISELVQLNAGLRLDTYTLVGDSVEAQVSPKIGASYQPYFGTIFHTSIGRGFRAATVVERFISAGSKDFRALPNPDLEPERSVLMDVGLRQNIGENVFVGLTAFQSTYKNLIEPTLASDLTAQFLNYPKARIRGIEAELRCHLWNRINLNSSATWMDPVQLENNQPLLYRPRFIAYFAPSLKIGPVWLEADYRYQGRLLNVAVYPLDERVPTKVWDARVIYPWKDLNFQFSIRNVLNYNYTVSERVLGEIRNFSFSISGDF
jgi:outer membrane receptor protein involved in Fe transport